MIKIYSTYKTINQRSGGANNFILSLKKYFKKSGKFKFVSSINQEWAVLFMNQLWTGPGGDKKYMTISGVENLMTSHIKNSTKPKLVVRAVSLNLISFSLGIRNLIFGLWKDKQLIKLLNIADLVIFQSEYQKNIFIKAGYKNKNFEIIHNGASRVFWLNKKSKNKKLHKIRLVSMTASERKTKKHDLIAKLSIDNNFEIIHIGRWPKSVNAKNVILKGELDIQRIKKIFSNSDYFFHPAIHDPCPNVIFEAICSGLPVIYNIGPGSSKEIVGICGFGFNEKYIFQISNIARDMLSQLQENVFRERHKYLIDYSAKKYEYAIEKLFA
jgi:glycosyltransferase involved in cell wall biosynthesis